MIAVFKFALYDILHMGYIAALVSDELLFHDQEVSNTNRGNLPMRLWNAASRRIWWSLPLAKALEIV